MPISTKNPGLARRILLALFAPILFLILIEILFAVLGLGDPPPFFVTEPNDSTRVARNPVYREFFATPPPSFLKDKPRSGFRVAVVGESTVAGYPYFYATFCDRLQVSLSDALPDYKCEVINAGVVGWTAFRLLDVLDACLQQKPDVVIWMVGHNEERSADNVLRLRAQVEHPVVAALGDALGHLRLARWIVELRTTGLRHFSPDITRSMPHLGPEAELIKQELRRSLRAAAERVKNAGARLILTTMPRNARTLAPSGSGTRPGLPADQKENLENKYKEALAAFENKDYAGALARVDAAIAIDRSPADAHFLRGRILEHLARCDEARPAFIESMERDLWPSRAREWTQQMIREQAAESGAPLADLATAFDARGNCNVAGAEWLCDDVHPNLEGHRAIAELIIQTLVHYSIPVPGDRWHLEKVRSEDQMRSSFGTMELETFAVHRALGYTKLFESLMFPPAAEKERAAAAAEARERLAKSHALVPGDMRVEVLLGTSEILSGSRDAGAERLQRVLGADRGMACEFARIVESGPLLRALLLKAGVDVSALAAASRRQ